MRLKYCNQGHKLEYFSAQIKQSSSKSPSQSYLNHLGVPEGACEDGPEPLGGLVDGDAAEEGLVVHVAVGQARQPVRVQHLHRPVEQPVLRRRPTLPAIAKVVCESNQACQLKSYDGWVSHSVYIPSTRPNSNEADCQGNNTCNIDRN